jgi:pyruvate/2-oxoglutarate dehydrogenase complex dihydrolipoamide dehydrogenase (E3) component
MGSSSSVKLPHRLRRLSRHQGHVLGRFTDEYDTVLRVAIGRPDTEKPDSQARASTNPKNGKVMAKYEQSARPNIYAVGDVLM